MPGSTKIAFTPETFPIDYSSRTLFLGSCFAVNMAAKFDFFAMDHTVNPFGVLFQPTAIEALVVRAVNKDYFTEAQIDSNQDIYFSFLAHSSCSALDKEQVVVTLNGALDNLAQAIASASHVVLTLGTAWVYRHIATDSLVANCHKRPNKEFIKELLTPDQIAESLDATMSLIRQVNPKAVVILTVSPVRHIKDGVVQNSRSKAHLLSGIHSLVEPRKRNFYFPAYELLMDELRDYRYYSSDLIHPNEQAIDYIWKGFKSAWIGQDALDLQQEIASLKRAKNHRSLLPGSKADKEFQELLTVKILNFNSRFPNIKL